LPARKVARELTEHLRIAHPPGARAKQRLVVRREALAEPAALAAECREAEMEELVNEHPIAMTCCARHPIAYDEDDGCAGEREHLAEDDLFLAVRRDHEQRRPIDRKPPEQRHRDAGGLVDPRAHRSVVHRVRLVAEDHDVEAGAAAVARHVDAETPHGAERREAALVEVVRSERERRPARVERAHSGREFLRA
jgi:hypothetical protein